jgi:Na+-transporting NADH:ubiquinone oxidoreductase subunit A
MLRIRKGLDLPLAGEPSSTIEAGNAVKHVAILGDDFVGMKPTMLVHEGDTVKLGQPLFADKTREGVFHTSPAAGRVVAIKRGAKRKFESVVIEIDGDESTECERFEALSAGNFNRDNISTALLKSGLWTALRTRPFSRTPAVGSVPKSIFVTAIESRPHAPDPAPIIAAAKADFIAGLSAVGCLTDGKVHVCTRPGTEIPHEIPHGNASAAEFDGPHPVGLAGTHIHFVDPVDEHKTVWSIGYQDVIAIGRLMTTGRIDPRRVLAIAGPVVSNPRLVRSRLGASVSELMVGETTGGDEIRLISGSVLDGRTATEDHDFVGRFHLQVSALSDHVGRALLGWMGPGSGSFSVTRAFTSALSGAARRFGMNTSQNGDHRPILPIGSYERVMPLDFEPTILLKAIVIEDMERAQMLGALELDEEDLALCSFVCPGKSSFGSHLRKVLTLIEKEG